MSRQMTTLAALTVVVLAGCGGNNPSPTLAFPDTATDPTEDLRSEDSRSLEDTTTPEDSTIPPDSAPPLDVKPPPDTPPQDTTPPDTGQDTGPVLECETDHDCLDLPVGPCGFWFCHPNLFTCKPASYPDGSPCDDGDLCTVGDKCLDNVCISGEVIPPPEVWDDPCNELVCDPESGWHPEPTDGPCDDGDPCTEGDLCHDGVCVAGVNICTPPPCGDGHCMDDESCETCPEDCGPCQTNCCEEHPDPGCDLQECEALVCNKDQFCCASQWDDYCVQFAIQFCPACGSAQTCGDEDCDFGESCLSCPEDCDGACSQDCCYPHQGSGCEHSSCQNKVCAEDDFCCNEGWDDYCVNWAQHLCGICQ